MIPILHVKGLFDQFWHSIPVIYLKTQEEDFKKWNLEINHPIGSLYWSQSPIDPGTFLGGTWTPIRDKFILAAGPKHPVGETGGAERVSLTGNQNGPHTHGIIFEGFGNRNPATTEIQGDYNTIVVNKKGPTPSSYTSQNSGSGESHENMPPYITRYCWERTA